MLQTLLDTDYTDKRGFFSGFFIGLSVEIREIRVQKSF
jgi:hypothetical protein